MAAMAESAVARKDGGMESGRGVRVGPKASAAGSCGRSLLLTLRVDPGWSDASPGPAEAAVTCGGGERGEEGWELRSHAGAHHAGAIWAGAAHAQAAMPPLGLKSTPCEPGAVRASSTAKGLGTDGGSTSPPPPAASPRDLSAPWIAAHRIPWTPSKQLSYRASRMALALESPAHGTGTAWLNVLSRVPCALLIDADAAQQASGPI